MKRAWFIACRMLGRLLRAGKYSSVRIVEHDGELQVRKHRAFYAPLLVRIGEPLAEILDIGVRVLPQHEWAMRERLIWRSLYDTSIRIDDDGMLVLPCLPGRTLATLLDDPRLAAPVRRNAIRLAVLALDALHRAGFTHGDAMAENVMVDLEAGVARWFDFETVHRPDRTIAWRRADDVRALLATCLLRTAPDQLDATLALILDTYADAEVAHLLARSFSSGLQRPLAFHLGQAGLSCQRFREIGRLLTERVGEQSVGRPPDDAASRTPRD